MRNKATFIGTFAPVPNVAGFELPLFRSRLSDITLVQELDESLSVRYLVEKEFAKFNHKYDPAVTTSEGGLGIVAVRCVDSSLLVGTQIELAAVLQRLVNLGSFDSVPLLRFRISAFFRLNERVADDAKDAWIWLKQSISQWSADNWMLESTIRPEIIRRIAAHLRAEGEENDVVEAIGQLVNVQMEERRVVASIQLPASKPWAARCKDLLFANEDFLGDATLWWPGLEGCAPSILDAQEHLSQPFAHESMHELLVTAKQFLDENLFHHHAIPKVLKNRLANTRILASQFEKIGDLVRYIERFSRKHERQMQLNLPTSYPSLESVHDEFVGRYGQYRDYSSDVLDLVPGRHYSGPFLSILSRSYTSRGGGILPVGKVGQHKAVIVKAAIDGAKYEDRWVEPEVRLKYYLKAKHYRGRTEYSEASPDNRSIIDFPELPILVFVKRQARPSLYSYHGSFKSMGVFTEPSGAKWFDLLKR